MQDYTKVTSYAVRFTYGIKRFQWCEYNKIPFRWCNNLIYWKNCTEEVL